VPFTPVCHADGMTASESPPLTVVRPGEGRSGDLGAITVDFKLFGADTGGALAIVEHGFPVGALVPPHVHTQEDEFSIVTQGEIGFRSGDREAVLGPGGYITKPRGEAHAMWNAGPEPARMIEVISPAGFELFFQAVVDMVEGGDVDPEDGARLAAKHGLSFVETPWLADVIQRFGLPPDLG
jgi:quercetin dioxygenase-like cupin family protein